MKYNIKSFGSDLSVDNPPEKLKGYNFLKNINSINDENNITFEKWVNNQNILNDNLIGQIDIEGAEYNLILNTPDDILKRFRILIFEFHNIQKIQNKIIYDFYVSALKKILVNFNVCLIHINNAETQTKIRTIQVPHLLEITFFRKDYYNSNLKKISIPNLLDSKNVPEKDNVNFDKNWLDIIT